MRRPGLFARLAAGALALVILGPAVRAGEPAPPAPRGPALLTFAELVRLACEDALPAGLDAKLCGLLAEPFVSNAASDGGALPLKPVSPRIGAFLRVATWNIEGGRTVDALRDALAGPEALASRLDPRRYPAGGVRRARVLDEASALRRADVIVLNEADWGVCRTGYRNVVEELAGVLGMNYAFGIEFLEVDPVQLGLERPPAGAPQPERVDPDRVLALHGTAILSRYRLENVRMIRHRHQPYDWFGDEQDGPSFVETGRRQIGERIFAERTKRQVRRGGRMMLLADISDPAIPSGRATILASHLEARARPEARALQFEEVLEAVRALPHPVIVAGDLNTSSRDLTPTTLRRELGARMRSHAFWLEQAAKYATGAGIYIDVGLGLARGYRTQSDPTARHVPLLSPNPEGRLFDRLERFRFDDGGRFDLRGDPSRSSNGKGGTLANSNERALKGFAATYGTARTIGMAGKFKLDWIFVKPPAGGGDTPRGYRFAPHFGRAFGDLNRAVAGGLSDHCAIAVDLPFDEPPGA